MASLVACLLNYMFLLRDVGTITEIVLSHAVSFRKGQTIFVSEITTRADLLSNNNIYLKGRRLVLCRVNTIMVLSHALSTILNKCSMFSKTAASLRDINWTFTDLDKLKQSSAQIDKSILFCLVRFFWTCFVVRVNVVTKIFIKAANNSVSHFALFL